jgi:hypothetical protein
MKLKYSRARDCNSKQFPYQADETFDGDSFFVVSCTFNSSKLLVGSIGHPPQNDSEDQILLRIHVTRLPERFQKLMDGLMDWMKSRARAGNIDSSLASQK